MKHPRAHFRRRAPRKSKHRTNKPSPVRRPLHSPTHHTSHPTPRIAPPEKLLPIREPIPVRIPALAHRARRRLPSRIRRPHQTVKPRTHPKHPRVNAVPARRAAIQEFRPKTHHASQHRNHPVRPHHHQRTTTVTLTGIPPPIRRTRRQHVRRQASSKCLRRIGFRQRYQRHRHLAQYLRKSRAIPHCRPPPHHRRFHARFAQNRTVNDLQRLHPRNRHRQ